MLAPSPPGGLSLALYSRPSVFTLVNTLTVPPTLTDNRRFSGFLRALDLPPPRAKLTRFSRALEIANLLGGVHPLDLFIDALLRLPLKGKGVKGLRY
jgi:hypothetical protein